MAGKDPYAAGMFAANPYAMKRDIEAELVVVLEGRIEERGLALMKPISRCVCRHEIHELIITDDAEAGPGKTVNPIAYLGFMEISRGGVIVAGDRVFLGEECIGAIAGFDETHMPNHLNIVVRSPSRFTGMEKGARLGQSVRILIEERKGE